MILDNPFFPLSFIAGPAVLTNACAVMQSGAAVRYSLAIQQWREFRTSLATQDGRLSALYVDPAAAFALAERRIHLLLRGLALLHAAVGLFGTTAFLGLVGAFLTDAAPASWVAAVMVASGGLGLLCLLAATVTFVAESVRARALIRLHLEVGEALPAKDLAL